MIFGAFWLPGGDISLGKRIAVEAESLGYDFLWTFEQSNWTDVFQEAALISTATSKIKLGPASISPYYRHPVIISGATLTLDKISGGRAILGVAAGALGGLKWLGLEYDNFILRLKETIEIIKKIFTEPEVNYKGKFFTLEKFKFLYMNKPIEKRAIPVYASVIGPQMLRMAGEVADGVMLMHAPPEYLEIVLKALSRGAEKKGRNLDEIDLHLHMEIFLNEDYDKALKIAKTWLPQVAAVNVEKIGILYEKCGLTKSEVELVKKGLKNLPEEVVEKILKGMSILGPAEDCIKRLKEYERNGVNGIQLNPITHPLHERGKIDRVKGTKLIGEKIIPAFR